MTGEEEEHSWGGRGWCRQDGVGRTRMASTETLRRQRWVLDKIRARQRPVEEGLARIADETW